MEGAFDGIVWWGRDTCHRLSRKSCDRLNILSLLRVALALIRATWIKEEKQFLMFSVSQKMVLGRVAGVFFLWWVCGLFCEAALGVLEVDRRCSSARV